MPDPDRQLAQRRAFGMALRALRKEAGISQELLGRVAGLQRAYVGHLENGRRNISLHTMWQLANALHVTPVEFFRDTTPAATKGQDERGNTPPPPKLIESATSNVALRAGGRRRHTPRRAGR